MNTETRILAALATILVVQGVSPASAQTVKMVASVPFEFRVGDSMLPGDVYRISRAQDGSGALTLRSERKGVIVLTRQGGPYEGAKSSRLVFHRVGDQYFLREVHFRGASSRELPETAAEREAVQRIASGAPAGVKRVVIPAPR